MKYPILMALLALTACADVPRLTSQLRPPLIVRHMNNIWPVYTTPNDWPTVNIMS